MPDALPLQPRRNASIAILTHGEGLTRKAGSFLGQCAVDPTPLTPAQASWFATLADRAGIELGDV